MTEERSAEEKAPQRAYELAYLVSPNTAEDKVAETVSSLKTLIEKRGAFVLSDEFPKFRQLAYTLIKPLGGKNEKYTNAYFGWIKFEAGADSLAALKADLEHEQILVRFLLVKVDRESKFPSKPAFWRKESPKRETPKPEAKTGPAMSEAEIDKTIEELVVE